MTVGIKTLQFSVRHAVEEEGADGKSKPVELPGWLLALNSPS